MYFAGADRSAHNDYRDAAHRSIPDAVVSQLGNCQLADLIDPVGVYRLVAFGFISAGSIPLAQDRIRGGCRGFYFCRGVGSVFCFGQTGGGNGHGDFSDADAYGASVGATADFSGQNTVGVTADSGGWRRGNGAVYRSTDDFKRNAY